MGRYITLFISLLFHTSLNAECDFKSFEYLKELNNPSSIKEIKLKLIKVKNITKTF